MTYFNLPYSRNVRALIGKKFLKLIDKCFPKHHPLNKIINRNTVKIGYKTAITRHNQKLLQSGPVENVTPGCNCTQNPCPLQTQNCQIHHVVYRATVTDEHQTMNAYTGLTRNTFKRRYDLHTFSFNHFL